MSTIMQRLKKLLSTKSNIKTSIEGKGGGTLDNVPFSEYSASIDAISGGGGTTIVNPTTLQIGQKLEEILLEQMALYPDFPYGLVVAYPKNTYPGSTNFRINRTSNIVGMISDWENETYLSPNGYESMGIVMGGKTYGFSNSQIEETIDASIDIFGVPYCVFISLGKGNSIGYSSVFSIVTPAGVTNKFNQYITHIIYAPNTGSIYNGPYTKCSSLEYIKGADGCKVCSSKDNMNYKAFSYSYPSYVYNIKADQVTAYLERLAPLNVREFTLQGNINSGTNFQGRTLMSKASVSSIISALSDNTGSTDAKVITFPNNLMTSIITDEDKLLITNKNWTIGTAYD